MKTRKITFGAMCLALSLLLPQAFHLIGMQQAGSVFLPMHIPVFIGGMLLGPIYGLFLGIFAPLTSFVVTGMSTAERVLFMMSELATYVFGIPLGGIQAVIMATMTGLPGIVIQLLFVPAIVTIVDRGGYFNEPETFTREA